AALKRQEETLSEIESDYTRITEEMAASDRQSADIRSRREENAEKIRYVEREQSERGMKQENIRQRLEDRYHSTFDRIRQNYAEALAASEKTTGEMDQELAELRQKLDNIGEVNLAAIEEFEEQKERLEFLQSQHDDLVEAIDDLHTVINKINRVSQKRFLETFRAINEKMNEVFPRLFEGGTAELVLTEPDKPLETGVELMVHPPGKKLTRLSLLSGGEKALSAIAFIFSIFLLKPTSFCLMDEIDAPLDEANIYRFNELLKIIGEQSQIVMVTHNKRTMEFADRLLGVTMEKKGISKLVSVDLNKRNGQRPQLVSAN
ncbi:MAG: AAA family ATPase, partial [Desulfosudaceae bacterium]